MTSASTVQTTDRDNVGTDETTGDPADHGTALQQAGLPQTGLLAAARRRLAPLDDRLDSWSWMATTFVVTIAAVLRLLNLSHPPGKVFDEIYYARDSWGLLHHGAEWNYETNSPSYVVHPPLGKWLIALGEWAFGYSDSEQHIIAAGHLTTTAPEFGWRISAALIGTLSVLLVVRIGRRMFRSTTLGCAAGLLMALDGFQLVLSRTCLLDIFLLFFVLASFGALVLDRDARRQRWLRALEEGYDAAGSGRLPNIVPWWRLASAILLGCALAVKWSALYFVPVFLILAVLWAVGARRSAGVRQPWLDTLRGETGWLVLFVALVFGAYLASWSGWLLTDGGYLRHWLRDNGHPEPPVIGALRNLWHYHVEAYKFHTTLEAAHPYQSWPWQWLLLGRPVAIYRSGDGPCGAASCVSQVLLLGTPILWWSFLPALVGTAWLGIARRDWRPGALLLSVAAGLLPWFWYAFDNRTMFFFYAAPAEPFLILAVVYVLGAIMSPVSAPRFRGAKAVNEQDAVDRRMVGAVVAGVYVLGVAICFAYFYPIFVGKALTYADWSARMWMGGRWI